MPGTGAHRMHSTLLKSRKSVAVVTCRTRSNHQEDADGAF